jgi:hypothetical protein
MAAAGLWTTASDLALFALGIQDALAGKPGAIFSTTRAQELLQPIRQAYALGLLIQGDGANRYFWHPGVDAGFVAFFFAFEKGDGVVLMTNGQNSKALMLEVIYALAEQYGWTEFPKDESRFSNPLIIGLICVSIVIFIVLATYFRVLRRRTKSSRV